MDPDPGLLAPPTGTNMKLPPGVVANSRYQNHAPKPPTIDVPWGMGRPVGARGAGGEASQSGGDAGSSSSTVDYSADAMTIWPSMRNAAVVGLTAAQLHQITGGRTEEAREPSSKWAYAMRRDAQRVLQFLYLGPLGAARDRAFLRQAGITKMIAIRDARQAQAQLLVVEHVAKEMGIESQCIDVADLGDLIRELPGAVQSINSHMLDTKVDDNKVSTGRVLVFCETGNLRSAAVVAAYVMAVYGLELVEALQYVNHRRFCTCMDEDVKHMLLSYSDVLHAQRDVARHDADSVERVRAAANVVSVSGGTPTDQSQGNGQAMGLSEALAILQLHPELSPAAGTCSASRPSKRTIEETMDDDDDRVEGASGGEQQPSREPSAEPPRPHLDMARYQDRKKFVPFTDTGPKSE